MRVPGFSWAPVISRIPPTPLGGAGSRREMDINSLSARCRGPTERARAGVVLPLLDLHAMTDKTVTHDYADVLESLDAKCYRASATARIRSNGMCEGWIEFVDLAGNERLRTDIETVQSNERAFRYWAAGVGPAYLEGAFRRATSRAADRSTRLLPPLSPSPGRAVLDPFEIDAQGDGRLAAELRALDLDRIREIALAYELVPPQMAEVATRAELIVEILATVSSARREPAERQDLDRRSPSPP